MANEMGLIYEAIDWLGGLFYFKVLTDNPCRETDYTTVISTRLIGLLLELVTVIFGFSASLFLKSCTDFFRPHILLVQ